MSNQQRLITLIKSLAGQANVLTIPRIYAVALDGYLEAALLLSQSLFWSDRTKDPNGWFYKTYEDWTSEIGLSKYQIGRAAQKLTELSLMETKIKKANGAPTVHYRVMIEAVVDWIVKFLDNQETSLSRNLTIDSEETERSDSKETSLSLTKTTIDHESIDYVGREGASAPPARHSRQSDPRSKHPAILCAKGITGHYPPAEIYDDLIRVLGDHPDGEKLAACRKEWITRGYNGNGWAWALEWYPGEIPTKNGPGVRKPPAVDSFRAYLNKVLEEESNGNQE